MDNKTVLEDAATREAAQLLQHSTLSAVQGLVLANQIAHAAVCAVVQVMFRKAQTADSVNELLKALTVPVPEPDNEGGGT